MWWTKPKIILKNGGDPIFSQIWQENGFFQKSKKIWSEKLNMEPNEINMGVQKLKYVL